MMISKKLVIPVKTGIQRISKQPKRLDSCLRRNDKNSFFGLFMKSSTVIHSDMLLSIGKLGVNILHISKDKWARWDSSKGLLFSILKGNFLALLLMMGWNMR